MTEPIRTVNLLPVVAMGNIEAKHTNRTLYVKIWIRLTLIDSIKRDLRYPLVI